MNQSIKVVLAHPDKQHSFKTAKALTEAGILQKYITSVYDKPYSWTRFLTKICRGTFRKKLQAHRSAELPDAQVKQYTELLSLLLLLLVRIDKSKKIYSKVKIFRDKIFNQKVARYCKKHNVDAVISFDVVSAQLYDYLGDSKIAKIMDMSAPQYTYMCSLFEKEVEKYPSSSLVSILNTPLVGYWRKQSEAEAKAADAFLVASEFTKKSLVTSGVDEARIYKCVYSINHELFNSDTRQKKSSQTLKCIYVGNVTEQKGMRYLFEAIQKLNAEKIDADFTVVGAYNPQDPLVQNASSLCKFTGHILPSVLKELLLDADVMVFPSLADGFGFSVLEAMACGVVPICSKNAGVSDLVSDGENGFTVDAMDSDAIYNRLMRLYGDREQLQQMSEAASNRAASVSWENYYQDIHNSIISILSKQG